MDIQKFILLLSTIQNSFGITIKELQSDTDKMEAYQLRYRVYAKSGYLDDRSHRDGFLKDVWDKYSILLGAYDRKNNLLGTIRITTIDPFSFPSDNLFVANYPFHISKAVEVGKFAVEKQSATRNRIVSFALTLRAALVAKKLNYNYWVFSTTPSLKKSFERLGSKIHTLSDQLLPIETIKKFCANWSMFETLDEQYFYLNINQLDPNAF